MLVAFAGDTVLRIRTTPAPGSYARTVQDVSGAQISDMWEAALARWACSTITSDRPHYFAVDDTVLESIAVSEGIPDGIDGFIAAARRTANSTSGRETDHLLDIGWNSYLLRKWERGDAKIPPPCLIALATDVLAASRMYDHSRSNPNSCFARLREILGLEPAARQVAGYENGAHAIWGAFNRWLRAVGAVPTAASRPGTSFANTGFAVSQALVNGVDRARLSDFFAAIALPPVADRAATHETVSGEDLLRRLTEWDRRTGALRPQFRSRLKDKQLTDSYGGLLSNLADAWGGTAVSETGEQLLKIHLAVYDSTGVDGTGVPELGRVVYITDDLEGARLTGRIGEAHVDVFLSPGWNHLVTDDIAVGAPVELSLDRPDWQLSVTAPTVVRRILDADCYTDGPGDGPLFKLGADGRTPTAVDLAPSPIEGLPRLSGGLRLDSRRPLWLVSGPPSVVSAPAGSVVEIDGVELGAVDDNGEFRLPPRELDGLLSVGGWSHSVRIVERLREASHAPALRHARKGNAYCLTRHQDDEWLCGAASSTPARSMPMLLDVGGSTRILLLGRPGEIHEISKAAPDGHRHARGLEWSLVSLETLHVRPGVPFLPWWVALVRHDHLDVWRYSELSADVPAASTGWWDQEVAALAELTTSVHNASAEAWTSYLTRRTT